jgi:hypothetical protein
MSQLNRRELFKLGALSGGAALLLGTNGAPPAFGQGLSGEAYPTSPLILSPFTDLLTVPQPLQPSDPNTWKDPDGNDFKTKWSIKNPWQVKGNIVPSWQNPWADTLPDASKVIYRIQTTRADHSFTSSMVLPIGPNGLAVIPPGGGKGALALPPSKISGFNGTFPGSMIYARYGTPCIVHFENLLQGWHGTKWEDGADFGVPSCIYTMAIHRPRGTATPIKASMATIPTLVEQMARNKTQEMASGTMTISTSTGLRAQPQRRGTERSSPPSGSTITG